jgi:Ser/Thr protein kinase RdoA (MazF antagonist)
MNLSLDVETVLMQFGLQRSAYGVEALGNAGGFSGARIWRVTEGARRLCLRQWPRDYPDETRLRFIHGVLEFAGIQCDVVPRLLRTPAGETAVTYDGHRWELTSWLPGVADFHQRPTPARLSAAMQALARVHQALELFPTRMTGAATSPGLRERLQRLDELTRLLPELKSHLVNAPAELRKRGLAIVAYFERQQSNVRTQLQLAAPLPVPLQPCLRDVWHDHVLFTGDEVTGIVDFDAVRIDTLAGDVARLLGSLVGDDAEQRAAGLIAYEAARPLSVDERGLIEVFDRSSLLMSGMNWLVWLLIDRRQFDEPARVYDRLDELLARQRQGTKAELWTGESRKQTT